MPESMPPLPPDQKPMDDEPEATKPPAHAVDANDVELAARLFKENGLGLDNMRITRVISQDFPKTPEFEARTSVTVHVQQLYHNLPVEGSGSGLVYNFNNAKLVDWFSDGHGEKRKILADLKIELKPTITRWQAIEGLRKYALLDPMVRHRIEGPGAAHLIILNTETSGQKPAKYILAWRVNIGGDHPFALIDATSGKMLSYDNGIRY